MVVLRQEVSDFLDSTRGISAIVVLLAHVCQFFILPTYGMGSLLQIITGYVASCAVMTFFVLSGFVIALSINNAVARQKKKWFLDFLARRIARIYPPLIFSLILTLIVCALIYFGNMHGKYSFRFSSDYYVARESIDFVWQEYISTFFMLSGFVKFWSPLSMNGPLWSVSFEFWLYIIAGLAVYGVTGKKMRIVGFALMLIVAFQIMSNNQKFFYFALMWFLGVAVFGFRNIKIDVLNKMVSIVGGLCLALMFFLSVTSKTIFIPYSGFSACVFQLLLMVLSVCLIVYFKVWKLFVFQMFRFAAAYSYTLYVIHFPLLLIGFSLLHLMFSKAGLILQGVILIVLTATIICIAAIISRWLENSKFYYEKMLMISSLVKSLFTKTVYN